MTKLTETALIPQVLGQEIQTVLASQMALADVEEGGQIVQTAPDRNYANSADLWADVLGERLRASMVVGLQEVFLSEWFPLTPGLFHTPEGEWSRLSAGSQLLNDDDFGPQTLQSLEEDIGRRIPNAVLNTMNQELVRVYSPTGKGSMMGGGVGCVRLKPRTTGNGDVWLMSASSTRIAHEGFPVVIPDELYARCVDVIAETGGLRCDLWGRLRFISAEFDPLFDRVVGIPRLFLSIEQIESHPELKPDPFLATGAVTFMTDWVDDGVRQTEWMPSQNLHSAFVTFQAGSSGSVVEATDWLDQTYVNGLFAGSIVTDFDEQQRRFASATFSLDRMTRRMLNPSAAGAVVDAAGASTGNRALFGERARQLAPTGKDFFISYTAADAQWAQWIAWKLEEVGYSTTIQAWDFTPGRDWVRGMQQAAEDSRRTIAVLSPDYFTSEHGAAEWHDAYARDPTGEAGRLVPVRVRECTAPGLLATRVWIDLVGRDAAEARDVLITGIQQTRAKPAEAPAYPRSAAPPFPNAD